MEAQQDIFSLYWNNNAVTDNNGLKIDVKKVDHRPPSIFEIKSMGQQRGVILGFWRSDKIVRHIGINLYAVDPAKYHCKYEKQLRIEFIKA